MLLLPSFFLVLTLVFSGVSVGRAFAQDGKISIEVVNSDGPDDSEVAPVPETGFDQTFALTFGAGIMLLGSYFYFWGSDEPRGYTGSGYFLRE